MLELVTVVTLAAFSPAWGECLDRSDDLAWFEQQMEEHEWSAAQVIIEGRGIGKGPVDYVQLSTGEIAAGWFHLTAQRDPLGLNVSPSRIHTDANNYWRWMQVLYSDQAPALQLEAWRRLVRPALDVARAAGWKKHLELVVAMANSSPVLASVLATECLEVCCMARRYIVKRSGRRSAHREHRVRALGYGRCL